MQLIKQICNRSQQEAGQVNPLKVMKMGQHWLLAEIHLNGPPHSDIAIRPRPAAPEAPSSPRPPSTGARPANGDKTAPLTASRAKPPAR